MTTSLDEAFFALSDPTRRGILAQLARGEATVNELVSQFALTQPTISSHLKVLENAGLISRGRIGQSRPCRLQLQRLQEVDDWLELYRNLWNNRFDRLSDRLTKMQEDENDHDR
ncbi:MAG TPA: metalloregulator ArsR/SmtB family transcription factor [Devosiaceae bacterium]|jgi:DNA-binding transcriptional ArsR family regulator|nr:metalloregulator ArsR/SmtB family transcription factor [Devosiaceae bacterium]